MARFLVAHAYRSSTFGPFAAGEVVDLDDAVADWVNRDSPGTLALVDDDTPTAPTPAKTPRKTTAKKAAGARQRTSPADRAKRGSGHTR